LCPADVSVNETLDASLGFSTSPGSPTHGLVALHDACDSAEAPRTRRGRAAFRAPDESGSPRRTVTKRDVLQRPGCLPAKPERERSSSVDPTRRACSQGSFRDSNTREGHREAAGRHVQQPDQVMWAPLPVPPPACPSGRDQEVSWRRTRICAAPGTAEAARGAACSPQARSQPKRRPLRRVRAPKCRHPRALRSISRSGADLARDAEASRLGARCCSPDLRRRSAWILDRGHLLAQTGGCSGSCTAGRTLTRRRLCPCGAGWNRSVPCLVGACGAFAGRTSAGRAVCAAGVGRIPGGWPATSVPSDCARGCWGSECRPGGPSTLDG